MTHNKICAKIASVAIVGWRSGGSVEQYVDSGSARYRDYQDISERKGSCLIFFAAFLSLFWPTSVGGVIVSYLPIVSILLSCFLLLIYSIGGKFIAVNVFVFCFFFLLLLFFTIISPFQEYTFGAIFPYLAMGVVLMISPSIDVGDCSRRLFHLMAVLLIILGFGVVFHVDFIRQFIFKFYQAYYEDLYLYMVEYGDKPVGPFATHSISAFIYAVFAIIYLRLSHVSSGAKSVAYFLLSLLFFSLIVLLKSFSAIAISSLLASMYFLWLLSRAKVLAILFMGFLIVCVFSLVDLTSFYELIEKLLSSDANGLRGRYSAGNRLDGTYEFLLNNPLMAIGMTSSPQIAFGDNFISDYVIRTGVFGYLAVLFSVFVYFLSSLRGMVAIAFAVGIVVLADLGYPLLTNFRAIFLFPVFIAMWCYPGDSPHRS
ncbi:TPA: hypothetical protein ACKQDU_002423 [Pseudomonas aeruginosa]|uniref:hypothetical protein n=1 Tax=Pseudomonas aeruginosa TaxID=287 RepID=UPI0012FE6F3D|nr:hypothetical protein [Pseudomonas aeruginosa]EKW2613708.1 hypothetical protein [Pseudomonas aeruginosa]MBG6502423.1 hypothetical protein [Pseudomonas aeruginosa]MCC0559841.1 hypothetical protein [Pseudomonas aeruginosa]MCO2988868.1 hypothetical protein [Pseudomonas aeruginosa]MDY1100690.1 hypothetical protein [Pseudomonas aeruginosa]